MNTITTMIPLSYRLLILFIFISVSVVLTSYSLYKKQHKTVFLEKYVTMTINNLENNIKKIDGWFEYIKKSPQSAFQELRKIIFNEIFITFVPTTPSTIKKSIGDTIPKIRLSLKDFQPNMWDTIKAQYNNIQQQMNDIRQAFPEDSNLPFEQNDLILHHYRKILKLKDDMTKLAADLQDCVEIAKEKKE